jgi:hypothetical protein
LQEFQEFPDDFGSFSGISGGYLNLKFEKELRKLKFFGT